MQSSMKNDEAKSKSPPPSKHVLDPKRLQNITILSKALNATAEQVCDALLQGNSPQTIFRIRYDNTDMLGHFFCTEGIHWKQGTE